MADYQINKKNNTMAYWKKCEIVQFDKNYKIDFDFVYEKCDDKKENEKRRDLARHTQIQPHIIDYIEHNVLETDKRFIAAQNTLNKFHKKYEIYENLDNMNLFDGDMQHWFYNNHIYYNVLKQISKVYIHSKYKLVLNRFVYLNCWHYKFVRDIEHYANTNCKRLQLAPTDIQIEVSLLCEILRAFDYSNLDSKDLPSCQISNVFSLRGKSMEQYDAQNFLQYLNEFDFLKEPEIFRVVAKGSFVKHSEFSKIIRKNMKINEKMV